ncbi:hypothetical protein M427DRAFT_132462 [Gonapodya prolifera JEL478]|uniref:D-serine dehydratase n=1 Tax=Gonapodya prolifera (strain JEL478) TaxID=1344416 RepID=A0A139AQG6_GONPJ|nr:hypothetical protein M427DRAFT_132462 [Gonapodya prolifera JEL478]|eukprot:KXS18968.1 hypothetical protein M427DRAFT_132462 [Gonapodya prolifera JEL478]
MPFTPSLPLTPSTAHSLIGSALSALRTPCLVVNRSQVERNCTIVRETCAAKGIRLRAHVKTHKCLPAALIQHGGKPGPIVCSTLAEAEHFAEGGFTDILYGVPVSPDKLAQLHALSQSVEVLAVLVDSLDAAAWLEEFARDVQGSGSAEIACTWKCWIKVDTGYHRAGISPAGSDLEARLLPLLQRLTSSPYLQFQGLYSHAGHSYTSLGPVAVAQIAREDRTAMHELAATVRKKLLEWKASAVDGWDVAVGSTPIALNAQQGTTDQEKDDSWRGITELHPGNYPFLDLQQLRYNQLPLDRSAARVLARVLARYPERREILIDAGSLALSKDSAPYTLPDGTEISACYGVLSSHPHLYVRSCSQEVSVIRGLSEEDLSDSKLAPGALVTIIPAHSCLAAGCFPVYAVVEDEKGSEMWGSSVVDVWVKAGGW